MISQNHCPSDDFKEGTPSGNCWGNGHYQCKNCIYYRFDFKLLGQTYIDFIHNQQGEIQILTLK